MESKELENSNEQLKSINSNNIIRNIKNNFILKIIFKHIHEIKLLRLIKYNKYIQKRINININTNYKTRIRNNTQRKRTR